MTQPNPLKHKFSTHSRPNPTQPNPRVNPTHGQLWDNLGKASTGMYSTVTATSKLKNIKNETEKNYYYYRVKIG